MKSRHLVIVDPTDWVLADMHFKLRWSGSSIFKPLISRREIIGMICKRVNWTSLLNAAIMTSKTLINGDRLDLIITFLRSNWVAIKSYWVVTVATKPPPPFEKKIKNKINLKLSLITAANPPWTGPWWTDHPAQPLHAIGKESHRNWAPPGFKSAPTRLKAATQTC